MQLYLVYKWFRIQICFSNVERTVSPQLDKVGVVVLNYVHKFFATSRFKGVDWTQWLGFSNKWNMVEVTECDFWQ